MHPNYRKYYVNYNFTSLEITDMISLQLSQPIVHTGKRHSKIKEKSLISIKNLKYKVVLVTQIV